MTLFHNVLLSSIIFFWMRTHNFADSLARRKLSTHTTSNDQIRSHLNDSLNSFRFLCAAWLWRSRCLAPCVARALALPLPSLVGAVVTVARTTGWALAVVHVLGAAAEAVRTRHDLRLRPASPPFLVQCFHEAFSVSPQRQRAAIMRLTIFAVFSADLLRSLCLGRRDAWLAVAVTAAAPRLVKCIRGLHGTVIYVVPPRMTREQWHRLVRLGAMAVVGACAWSRR